MDFLKGAMERVKPEVERLIRRELDKMTETNAKIHVLADETLGGIKREYVEIDRKAEVGEKIVIVEKADWEEWYKNGDVFTVDREYRPADGDVESDGASSDTNCSGLIYREEYRVLEPTNIVHIGTQHYELTDRMAEVGEKVIVVKDDGTYETGSIFTTKETDRWLDGSGISVEEFNYGPFHKEYRVLVPVESAEADEPQPIDPIFAIGNVAQEVAKLKRTVERLENEIDTLHKDNRTLGEELQKTQQDLRETMDDVSVMDEDIKRTGSDINEMSFAVEELAEALKKTDPVYGERIFTAEEVVAVMTALKVRP
ncbi:hypothetical protein ABWW12_01945 [Bacillus subtilis]|uniref:hypothetical protein n=1 Tax=Bacillus subtilis TaxID=1423 RepID=UPI00018CC865